LVVSPAAEPRFSGSWVRSIGSYYIPQFAGKLHSIIEARDQNLDPFALLSEDEAQALRGLYSAGAPVGSEFAWDSIMQPTISGWLKFYDHTYADHFWTLPGYAGYEGEVDGLVVEGITGTVTALGHVSQAHINALGKPTRSYMFGFVDGTKPRGWRPSDDIRAWKLPHAHANLSCWTVRITSGLLAGRKYTLSSGRGLYGAMPGSGSEWAKRKGDDGGDTIRVQTHDGADLTGLAVGDTYVIDNRERIAWSHIHRYIVSCDRVEYKDFCMDGRPIYVQRPASVQEELEKVAPIGDVGTTRLICLSGAQDVFIWPINLEHFYDRVRESLGTSCDEQFRAYWFENAGHENPGDVENIAVDGPVRLAHSGWPQVGLAFEYLSKWVETGTPPPPSTAAVVTPGTVQLPDGVLERKGLQPVVSGYANGAHEVTVEVGTNVEFDGTAESPIGNITKYEWDFNADGCFEYSSSGAIGSNDASAFAPASRVRLPANYTYDRPGCYAATVRVTDDASGPGTLHGFENLARVIVTVR
jgi:hypothetical protein